MEHLQIKRLTPEMADDFLRYFDEVAFTDHEEWNACYCLEGHMTQAENDALSDKSARREKARHMVETGAMQGYLVYAGQEMIAWCSAGCKAGYRALSQECFCTGDLRPEEIFVLYCMDVAPAWRGQGLARQLIDRVVADAREAGFTAVEVYPFGDTDFAWQYRGPKALYERMGFQVVADRGWISIMQKRLA